MRLAARWKRWLLCLPAAVVVAFGVLVTPAPAASAGWWDPVPLPSRDPFYVPPDPLPTVPPGTVLRSREFVPRLAGLPVPVTGYQVLYRSTDAHGRPNAVSGTLLLPKTPAPPGGRQLLTYNTAHDSPGQDCAPSYAWRSGTALGNPLVEEVFQFPALLRGLAVFVSDYPGSGTPGPSTMFAGRGSGRAVLDGIRAVQRLPASGLDRQTEVALWGYSGGAFVTAWAAELHQAYAPEVNLVGSAAGGIPVIETEVFYRNDGTAFAGLGVALAASVNHAYPEYDIESILNDKGKAAIAEAENQCVAEIMARYAFHRLDDYTVVPDAIELPRFQALAAELKLGQSTPDAPLHAYHTTADQILPVELTRGLLREYCAEGVTVDYAEYPVGEHLTGTAIGAPAAFSWLMDRFAGKPAPNDCATLN